MLNLCFFSKFGRNSLKIAGMKGMIKLPVLTGFVFFALLVLVAGCGGNVTQKDTDTPTGGRIRMGLDNSYRLLMEAEIFTFETIYKYAKIDTLCRSEADIIDAFMKDSIPLMVVNRKLTEEEEKWLNSKQIIPRTLRIAYDAVALILNPANPDSNILFGQIEGIFRGKVTTWKQINPQSRLGDVKVIFDNYKSSNTRYFREKFNIEQLPGTCFAVNNNEEVIRFVERNPEAIGIISVNWISDKQDTVSHRFLSKVKVASVNREGTDGPEASFYTPHPGYVAEGFYPFTREVYMINRQTYSGLAYGFTSFVAGNQGQLIVLRSGMVPATMPVRLVEIRK